MQDNKPEDGAAANHQIEISPINIASLSSVQILQHSSEVSALNPPDGKNTLVDNLQINQGNFVVDSIIAPKHIVQIILSGETLSLSCTCGSKTSGLCKHQTEALFFLLKNAHIRIFFDQRLRHDYYTEVASDYGLENETFLEDYFTLVYHEAGNSIVPIRRSLIRFGKKDSEHLKKQLVPPPAQNYPSIIDEKLIVVIGKHKYYDQLDIQLYEINLTKTGKIKAPLSKKESQDFIWKLTDVEHIRFFSSLSHFQNRYETSSHDMTALKILVKNPLGLAFYFHQRQKSETINPQSLQRIQLSALPINIRLEVISEGGFYETRAFLIIQDSPISIEHLQIYYDYFLMVNEIFYLLESPQLINLIQFFQQHHSRVILHHSKFEDFKSTILDPLEKHIDIHYTYIRPATQQFLHETRIDTRPQPIIYLSENEGYVELTPVMKYGAFEVGIMTKQQVYTNNDSGAIYQIPRNEEKEDKLLASMLRQHPDFYQQLEEQSMLIRKDHFYLPKSEFLNPDWFLKVMEEWLQEKIQIFGFDSISHNRYNMHKGKVRIQVLAEVNWFDTQIVLEYGDQQASLHQLQRSVKKKSQFVELGDGTLGMLPKEWIDRFEQYFQSGQIIQNRLLTPKIKFGDVNKLYDPDMLDLDARNQMKKLRQNIRNLDQTEAVQLPSGLQAVLRPYQLAGVNWMQKLDQLGFGGCLADDMGLGKTVQVIAFLLLQKHQHPALPHLIVVPVSLLFNWESEIQRFAPELRVIVHYGPKRATNSSILKEGDIILTSYHTLLSDIKLLTSYFFNYIILDESQAIKNPTSQRYKAACLLKGRNRLTMTGTPMENNTMDLYGQLSFACPGLLGTRRHFIEQFSMRIDKFKDKKKMTELRKRTKPFILRRTKKEVATDLPEKTEMTIFCPMGKEQRRVYDAYKKEYRDYFFGRLQDKIRENQLHILQGLTKLRQICNSPQLLNDEHAYNEHSAKIEVLLDEVENHSPDHKIIIFSQFVGMLELISQAFEERKIRHELLTGKTVNRKEKVETFQNDPDLRVFLISLKAGGTGLNLTAADYVYLVDPWWNPSVENQAIDRTHRIGQKKNIVAVRLICPDTIEEKVLHLQATKKYLISGVVHSDMDIAGSISTEDLEQLFE